VRTVEEAREAQLPSGPRREAVPSGYSPIQRAWGEARKSPGRGAGGAGEGHERDNVEDPDTRVDADVAAQVEQSDGRAGKGSDRRLQLVGRPGQGEDRPVVVGVLVHIEHRGTAGADQAGDDAAVAALADVDYALQHRITLSPAPIPRAPAGGGHPCFQLTRIRSTVET